MKKIPTLFARNHDGDHRVRAEVTPECAWVLAGEGVATRKWDGTACLVRAGKLYKRYELKPGKPAPADFEPANDVDSITGKQAGWRPVGMGPEDRYHRQAWALADALGGGHVDGTYELLGPKVQGGADSEVPEHLLMPHGKTMLPDCPRDFAGLYEYLTNHPIEGIVWWHADGRMAKLKRRDFGLPWPVK